MESTPKLYGKAEIEFALSAVGAHCAKPVKAYLIGGCAMSFRSLKPSTKDADLLFEDELSEKRFFEASLESGFKELFPGSKYLPLTAKDIVFSKKTGLQLDLFAKTVMAGLSLSPSMAKRAESSFRKGKFELLLAAKEDIYLFKAITDRPFPRDYEDLLTLQQSGLDWDVVIAEYETQVRGRKIEKNLKAKMEKLREEGITNPLMRVVGSKS